MSLTSPITLNVNEDNDDGTTAEVERVYSRQEIYNGRSVYTTDASSPLAREILGFYATPAKPSGNILGTSKASFKITRDVEVPGADGVANYTRPNIWEVVNSRPAGANEAFCKADRMALVAILMDDVLCDQLFVHGRTQ